MEFIDSVIGKMQQYIGIIDITILVSFIVVSYIGYKKGFFEKVLSIASSISGIFIAFLFAGSFVSVVEKFFYSAVYTKISVSLENSEAITSLTGTESVEVGVSKVLEELGLPDMLASAISKGVDSDTTISVANRITHSLADFTTDIVMHIMSFVFLWIGLIILIFILRLIVKLLRTNKIFKVVDGIFGIVMYIFLDFVILVVIFFVLPYIVSVPLLGEVKEFIIKDMRLDSYDGIGIGRWFYKDNIAANFFRIFF